MATQQLWTSGEEARETLSQVLARAARDKEFRDLCLSDPAKAVEAVAGKAAPAGFKIAFFEPGDAQLALVLPPFVGADGELSDAALAGVAGGMGFGVWRCSVCGRDYFGGLGPAPYGWVCPSCGYYQ